MKAEVARVRIRRMRAADLERAMAIAAGLKEAPQWPRTAYESALDPDSAPRRIALVAEEPQTGAMMGFAVASLLAPQGELEMIAVAEGEQRRGVGRNLFLAMVEALKAEGVREAMLEVRSSNHRALGFHQAQGWSETGRRPRYYADPEEDAVLMRLGLA